MMMATDLDEPALAVSIYQGKDLAMRFSIWPWWCWKPTFQRTLAYPQPRIALIWLRFRFQWRWE